MKLQKKIANYKLIITPPSIQAIQYIKYLTFNETYDACVRARFNTGLNYWKDHDWNTKVGLYTINRDTSPNLSNSWQLYNRILFKIEQEQDDWRWGCHRVFISHQQRRRWVMCTRNVMGDEFTFPRTMSQNISRLRSNLNACIFFDYTRSV